jgi:hypothetical protein
MIRSTFALVIAVLACLSCGKGDSSAASSAPIDAAAPGAKASPLVASAAPGGKIPVLTLSSIPVRAKETTTIRVGWKTPEATAVNDDAPFRVRWDSSEGLADAPPDMKTTGSVVKEGFTLKVRPFPSAPKATLDGELSIVVCDAKDHSICLPVRRMIQLAFIPDPAAPSETSVSIMLPPAK